MRPPCWNGWDNDRARNDQARFRSAYSARSCWRCWPSAALAITGFGFWRGARGAWARGLAFAILLFALAGPLLVKETHAALPDVVALVIDRSQSMGIGNAPPRPTAALAALRRQLGGRAESRRARERVTTTTTGENNGTQAFAALNSALADVPPDRDRGRDHDHRRRGA